MVLNLSSKGSFPTEFLVQKSLAAVFQIEETSS